MLFFLFKKLPTVSLARVVGKREKQNEYAGRDLVSNMLSFFLAVKKKPCYRVSFREVRHAGSGDSPPGPWTLAAL